MLKIGNEAMNSILVRMKEMPTINSKLLNGFACSASDNSCGCGWDCSSTKT